MRLLASLALLAGLLTAQTKITSVEGITEYRLDNGLDVLLFPDNSKPTVTVNITYLVGSRHEGYGETGMAHLLEHMLFKGTQKRNEIMGELSSHGADFNGSTWYDRTNYFETVQSTDDNLKWALDLEADRMVNSRVSRKDLDSEMTVVRNEFEKDENDPNDVLYERVLSTAYLWHGYGRSSIGSRSDIENVPIDKLQAFYKNYYQPDNAVLVIAGKFDPDKALGWVKDNFNPIPKPSRKLSPTYTEEPVQDGEREVNLRRVGDTQAWMAAYHIPAGSHPDIAALDVLQFVLGDAPSGRLYKALVETKKATSVDASDLELKDPGMLLISAQLLKEGSLKDVETTILRVIDGVIAEPPTKQEVDRAKTRLLKDLELSLNNSSRVGLTLSEYAASGDWRLLFLGRDQIEKVTPEDVARVAKTYLKSSNRTIGRFIPDAKPDRSTIPPNPDVAALLKDYKGKPPLAEGEVFDPSPTNIEARTTRISLPSGLKIVLLPKKTRGGTVIANLNLHFGDEKTLAGKSTAAEMAGSMLLRGTQKHTRQDLQDEFDKIKAQISVSGSVTGASARINTLHDGLAPALRLVAEVLRTPSFPEAEFEQIRQSSIADIEASRSEPDTIVGTAMERHLSPYPATDPRYVPTIDESIDRLKKVKLAESKAFYAGFYGASNAELSVVGDFDPAEIRKLAEELLGSWKSPKPYAVVKREWKKLDAVNDTFEAPDKTNATLYAVTAVPMDQQDPDYPLVYMANQLIGHDEQSRLWKRIREKEGLSYGVYSYFSAGAQEKRGTFTVSAIANPANVPKVETALKEELARVLKDGFDAAEVAAGKSAFLQERQIQRARDGSLAGLLVSQAELGRTMQREIDLEKRVMDATPEQLAAAFRKWVDPATLSYFKAGDFKKAGVTK
jgi:zinc protease